MVLLGLDVVAVPGLAAAQDPGGGWIIRQTNKPRLARLAGPSLNVAWSVVTDAALYLSVDRLTRTSGVYAGDTCGGFVPPGCPRGVPVRDEGIMYQVGVGARRVILNFRRVALLVELDTRIAHVWERTARVGSTDDRRADAFLFGVGGGVGLAVYPRKHTPLALTLGVGTAVYRQPGPQSPDAYEPFHKMSVREARIGVAWTPRTHPVR